MDDTLLFIPPCCIARKLPQAIHQAPRGSLIFYTQGDVIVEKFYKAISYLLVDPHVFALSLPLLASDTCVFLQQCFERQWITSLILTTSSDQSDLLNRYLSEYLDRIIYAYHKDVGESNSYMVLYNAQRALVLTGAMYERPYNHLSAYSVTFYASYSMFSDLEWGNPIKNVLFPTLLHHRQLRKKLKAALEAEKKEANKSEAEKTYEKKAGAAKKKIMMSLHSPFFNINRQIHSTLTFFLSAQFPPYHEENLPASRGDHYIFGQM